MRCRLFIPGLALLSSLPMISCGSDGGTQPKDPGGNTLVVRSITIEGGSRELERGTQLQLVATVRNDADSIVSVPVAWRSLVDSIASVDRDGILTARDTGVTGLVATALGVSSQAVGIHVVWRGAAKVEAYQFSAPNAVTPGAVLGDSIRVAVTTLAGGPAANALVKFQVTAGGGTASSTYARTGINGLASTRWTLGGAAGANTLTASVVADDSATAIAWVAGNPTTFSVTSYAALAAVRGDAQSGQILAPLATTPAIKLVDASGNPRAGIPITFTATANGKVETPSVSTGADGIASPGIWTLGDAPGAQQLIVTVEAARFVFHASASGTPTYLMANGLAAGAGGTCVSKSDHLVSCFGAQALLGTNATASSAVPVATSGDVHFASVDASVSHVCGISNDGAVYCWGVNALADTTGVATSSAVPTKLQGATSWAQVTAGDQHNCALTSDHVAFCWGADASGQLGDNGSATRFAPREVAGGFHFSALAAGDSHECGLSTEGSLFCWGLNSAGQLGDSSTTNRATPTVVRTTDKFTALGAGTNWTCALDTQGRAQCWGVNTGHIKPQPYDGAPTFASLSVGSAHACGLTSDGTAYCWGDNSGGQLGDSTTVTRAQPVAVATSMRFSSIAAGTLHTCGITLAPTAGAVACWGRNQYGEIGVTPVTPPAIQLTPRFIVLGVQP